MITAKQMACIELLFEGKLEKDVAEKLGIRRETIWRWKQEIDYKHAFAHKKQVLDTAISIRLQRIATKALEKLERLIDDGNEQAIYKSLLLYSNMKNRDDVYEIQSRLNQLEKIADENEKQTQLEVVV